MGTLDTLSRRRSKVAVASGGRCREVTCSATTCLPCHRDKSKKVTSHLPLLQARPLIQTPLECWGERFSFS